MFVPCVRPGMEKPRHLLGHGIASRNIWSFVAVAVVTRKRQIADVIGSAVFPSCDVIHLEREPIMGNRYVAVLTSIFSSIPQFLNDALVHWRDEEPFCFVWRNTARTRAFCENMSPIQRI